MASQENQDSGPDLSAGVPISAFDKNALLKGHVGEEPVVLARVGDEILAVGGACTHYSGPLGDGILVGDTIHCPWHHACFSLRTGEALAAPAFSPLARWKVEHRDGSVFVTEKLRAEPQPARDATKDPKRIVIVGGGAAGFAAAEMLRRRGFAGQLTMLSADEDAPYDRPNLSKDYLAGEAEDSWIPLRSAKFYARNNIDLKLSTSVDRIDRDASVVVTSSGEAIPFDRLLLATGAEPIRLPLPGTEQPNVFVLRSLADSRAIIAAAEQFKSAAIIGASFIGLEVAAALRTRGLEVHVVAPEAYPLEKVLGKEFGAFIRSVHEEHGVRFHLGTTPSRIDDRTVQLSDGKSIGADFVVMGVGVKPRIAQASKAGIATDKGILVDEFLETSVPGIFAAGDIAQWQDKIHNERRRVEHWVVAERQGQVAAENMLGMRRPFTSVPFFWSAHYDVSIRYIGYATSWDAVEIDGSIEKQDCIVAYKKGGQTVAAASINRDIGLLECEVAMGRLSEHKAA
ncbi:FAD-dependent oxidoreductase [Pseudaminobacter soli (ex Li et al. 2025)]|uniref:Pyridine nucleotide-disulfide oxidoreductase n=1 Tax=Pseudaminobacter soli (ex Li et al. 2025) TaxID=1295366 RepID=A0A2P7RPL9_9HYPH|nr:FAD-dependent oxidoreductase [Mesorhizobium soli]PSJ52159.1 pyridine nucleotide-disulfide oxidoreductase [Mesorhizobium soli]